MAGSGHFPLATGFRMETEFHQTRGTNVVPAFYTLLRIIRVDFLPVLFGFRPEVARQDVFAPFENATWFDKEMGVRYCKRFSSSCIGAMDGTGYGDKDKEA
jgi:hypothetical protein